MVLAVRIVLCGSLVAVLALGCFSSSADDDYSISAEEQWEAWKEKFNKVYGSADEEGLRKAIWMMHYKVYTEHMANRERQFDMEMNEFSDKIIARNKLPFVPDDARSDLGDKEDEAVKDRLDELRDELQFAPTSWDWRDHGVVTPVINQGMVNDVVSIVATESVESFFAVVHGKLFMMSFVETTACCVPEPVLDRPTIFTCIHSIGESVESFSAVVRGKLFMMSFVEAKACCVPEPVLDPPTIFTCIHNIGGMCAANTYPATAGPCRNQSCTAVGTVNGAKQSTPGNEQALLNAVFTVPVMAGVDASHSSFQMYKSGVYSEPACSHLHIDHVVQIVGFGSTKDGKDYWICKNSWGTNWGMAGYILIARNQSNMCGIASQAFVPV